MAHFAELNQSNEVLRVLVISNADAPTEELGVAFCHSLFGQNTIWKQTSYTGAFRKQFAGPGYHYEPNADVFYAPMPHDGFTYELNKNWDWVGINKPANYVSYGPSPETAVPKLLDILKLSAASTFVDLGSGDGRAVIAAAKYGMTSSGVEANPALIAQAKNNAEQNNVQVSFIQEDLLKANIKPYSVIYMYLGKPLCDLMLPKLKALPTGVTIISGDYCYPDWTPIETHEVDGITFSIWKT